MVLAWILTNQDAALEGFVSNVTQALRQDPKAYDLESLSSVLLDESKRQNHKETPLALLAKDSKKVSKNSWKKNKGKYCKVCKKTNYEAKDCYILHPDKALKSWREKFDKLRSSEQKEKDKEKKSNEAEKSHLA